MRYKCAPVVAWGINQVLGLLFVGETGKEQVENVEVALALALGNDAGLFQQVLVHEGTLNAVAVVEAQLNELSEAR